MPRRLAPLTVEAGGNGGAVLEAAPVRVQRGRLAERLQRVPPRTARTAGGRHVGGADRGQRPVEELRREGREVSAGADGGVLGSGRRRLRLGLLGVAAAPAAVGVRRHAEPGGEGRRRGVRRWSGALCNL